jgi:drug/metabolite transporter (DMT)-like permease
MLVQIIFGINFVASKIIVSNIAPIHWAWIRFFVSGIVLLLFILIIRKKMVLSKEFLMKAAFFGFLGFTIGQLTFLKGIKLTTAVNSSIICSMIPMFTLLAVIVRGLEKLTFLKFIGFIFAFSGVVVLRGVENFKLSDSTMIGDVLVLVCAFSTGLYIAFSKNFVRKFNHLDVTTWMFLFAAVQLAAFSFIDSAPFAVPSLNSILVASMLFAIVGATFLTYFLSNWALVYVDSTKVSVFIYLQPVVASIFAISFLGESITIRTGISIALIIVGFFAAVLEKKN